MKRGGSGMDEFYRKRLKDLLGSLGFLPHINDERFQKLTEVFHHREFKKGDIIIQKDEAGDTFFIVSRGRAQVLVEDPEDEIAEAYTFQEGEFFGEIALITGGVRTAWVVATGKVEAFMIDRSDLEKYLLDIHEISEKILSIAKARLISSD